MTSSTRPDPSALPNALSLGRLLAGPVVAALLFWGSWSFSRYGAGGAGLIYGAAFALFVLAAATDWLDGKIARARGATSPLGAALDHAADKSLVCASLVALAATFLSYDLVIASAIIIAREVAVAGLREGLALSGRALPVSGGGKLKTTVQLVGVGAAILSALLALVLPVPETPRLVEPVDIVAWVTRISLWLAAGLAVWTGVTYFREALRSVSSPSS